MKHIRRIVTSLAITAILLALVFPTMAGAEPPSNEIADNQIVLNGKIEVNGKIIEAPAPYIFDGDASIAMVPLRAVAESLGYTVLWEKVDLKDTVILGYGIQLWIGVDYYRVGPVTTLNLYPAPELRDSRTFVALDFFEHVLGYDAYISGGTVVIKKNLTTTTWVVPEPTAAWFADDLSQELGGAQSMVKVGKTSDGGDVFGLIRLPLGADWFADEVTSARLRLKIAEGTPPHKIYVGTVTHSWVRETEADRARSIVNDDSLVLTELRQEEGGWVSMDVTDIVVSWLRNDIQNKGFALIPGNELALGAFYSGINEIVSYAPRLVVSGKAGERPLTYGRFGFTMQPVQGIIEPMDGGNCFSYAVRDLDGVYNEDLNTDLDELEQIYAKSGINGILEHTAAVLENYVEKHKQGLQISGFRRIDDFDSPIDPKTEYRIVLRVALDFNLDGTLDERTGYDFHLWAQLNDGRWTQTHPNIFSEIIPYVGPGVDPVKFYWDAGVWGLEKYQEWYKSGAVYFAVTKDTDEFTSHKKYIY